MKKIISIIIVFAILLGCVPSVFALEQNQVGKVKRYTILVLDVSGPTRFLYNNQPLYTAGTSISYIKAAALGFLEDIRQSNDENYVAIVSYADTANITSDFTNNFSSLTQKISNLQSGGDRSIARALNSVNNLLNVIDDTAIKNVVLFTTGIGLDIRKIIS